MIPRDIHTRCTGGDPARTAVTADRLGPVVPRDRHGRHAS